MTDDQLALLALRPSAVCEQRDTPLGTQYRIRLVLLNGRQPGPWLTEKWYGTEAAAWGAALRCVRSPNREVE